jgi:hypothetical protein
MNSPLPPLLATPEPAPLARPEATPPLLAGRPGVVRVFRLWCALFVALYAGMCLYEVQIACGAIEPDLGLIEGLASKGDPALREKIFAEKRSEAPGVAAFVLAIAGFYVFAAVAPRKPWAWTVGIVALAGSILPFIITAAGAVPILLYWGRPEVKRYFHRRVP